MPERGVNAIYKAARAITRVEQFALPRSSSRFMGNPTISVGMISGGLNANSVPDRAEFTIDVRSGSDLSHAAVLDSLRTRLQPEVEIEPFIDMPAVYTPAEDPFIDAVFGGMRKVIGDCATSVEQAMPFFSDASVLQPHYRCPTIILGPGEVLTAHETDEYCLIDKIHEAEEIYLQVIDAWCGTPGS